MIQSTDDFKISNARAFARHILQQENVKNKMRNSGNKWLPIRNGIAFLGSSISALFIIGCSENNDSPPPKIPDEILAEETQAEKTVKEQRMREYEEKKSTLESNLKK